ncbi:MAG: cupin domain-containing protein [Planctomycetota bacterium]|nr:cupin domain-containing protein [Planctomycetota bacterium]
MPIQVRKPTEDEIKKLGVRSWPIWECEPSTFDWHYDTKETCLVLEGQVTVEAPGESVSFGPGDLVTFPQGMDCKWKVAKAVKKHYKFG